MLTYLGRRLARSGKRPVFVTYLSKAEGEPVWRKGRLLSIDAQGACFETQQEELIIAECLPWGSIGGIRIGTSAQNARLTHDEA